MYFSAKNLTFQILIICVLLLLSSIVPWATPFNVLHSNHNWGPWFFILSSWVLCDKIADPNSDIFLSILC